MGLASMATRAAGYIVKAATDWNVMVNNITELIQYSAVGQVLISTSTTTLTPITLTRSYGVQINSDAALAVGDNQARFHIPASLNGWKITAVSASRQSGTGVPLIQIRNATSAVDVLSTRISIDTSELTSFTAATPPVINSSNNTATTGHLFSIDIDATGTATLGLYVLVEFTRP